MRREWRCLTHMLNGHDLGEDGADTIFPISYFFFPTPLFPSREIGTPVLSSLITDQPSCPKSGRSPLRRTQYGVDTPAE